jgi:uncharacterized protein YyaL (SSP411 family)
MPNALQRESSPYLRQHQDNPVDWLPWGELALQRSRDQSRPLLVSIGYSSCHWCHVMERESFEDPRIAALMNENFVCVKVDREERPDIDAIYMEAVQVMTGHGGWPLNVFLTPEQLPFYGGTYFPPEERHGLPAFSQVLQAIATAWSEQAEDVRGGAERIRERLCGGASLVASENPITSQSTDHAVQALRDSFDPDNGGFGGAPKFPPASAIEFLLARAAAMHDPPAAASDDAEMALQTLRAMAVGGICDQLGGGFHRYAVDGSWRVPHFEKMLYDNALLARAYLHAFKLSGERELLDVCIATLDWALREMRGPEGGFYSALDADSEGIEGQFYVWRVEQLREALGADAEQAIAWFGAREQGNFEDPHHPQPGLNVLQGSGPQPDSETRARIRGRLLALRSERVRPSLDDKRLTSWNALMIGALAESGAYLKSVPARAEDLRRGDAFLDAAIVCAEFVLGTLRDGEGRLLRTYNNGEAKLRAYLEDYAFLLEALLDLYEASFQERWFIAACELAESVISEFSDSALGGFFSTAADHEQLITRRKELEDTPIPSGASSAALGLLRLAALTGRERYEHQAVGVLRLTHELAPRHPSSFGHLLRALDFYVSPTFEVAIIGEQRETLVRVVRERLRPHLVLAASDGPGAAGTAVALLEGRTEIGARATAYVCERFACGAPVTDPADLTALLD